MLPFRCLSSIKDVVCDSSTRCEKLEQNLIQSLALTHDY